MLCPVPEGRSMADDSQDALVSRRDVLKRVGIASAAAAMPIDALAQATREPFDTLTAAEGATLEAIVARLIPTDANGPGAAEARAARYIDRALGGFLASSLPVYRAGLAGIETYTRAAKGMAFTQLSAQEQDAVLTDVERNAAKGFTGASFFFNVVLSHTIQGTFGDPFYGGNANFVGWDLLGYPGIRLTATANDQRMDVTPKPTHMSAYDFSMFARKKPDAR
jgi:gluconate 2-dehydrogenase gamma chain